MISLLLNIIFASAFTLIIKWVQVRQREDICTVGPINYIVAAVLIAPQILRAGCSTRSGSGNLRGTGTGRKTSPRLRLAPPSGG